jgi:hypothetical protein
MSTSISIPEGPYHGQPVCVVPTLALYLILEGPDLDTALKSEIQSELDRRSGIMQGRRRWQRQARRVEA